MPSIEEKPQARSGTSGRSARRVFSCLDYATPGAAVDGVYDLLVTAGETLWEGLTLRTIAFEEPAPRVHDVTVEYGSLQALTVPATGVTSYDFSIALDTVHIDLSPARVAAYALAGHTAPSDLNIGVNLDGEIGGVDILVPTAGFGVIIRPPNGLVTEAYRILCGGLVGKVNNANFAGRPAGEVLFAGLRGGTRTDGDSELRLEFLERRNAASITIGGITGVSKEGWDYLWPWRERVYDPVAKRRVPKIVAVLVERVYERANLNALLI